VCACVRVIVLTCGHWGMETGQGMRVAQAKTWPWGPGCGLVVERSPSMHEALGFVPTPAKTTAQSSPASAWGIQSLCSLGSSFQLTVEMFDYLECELDLFQTGECPLPTKPGPREFARIPAWLPQLPSTGPGEWNHSCPVSAEG
jgi:hypothetical protein